MRWGTALNWSPNGSPSGNGVIADFQVDVPSAATVGVASATGGNLTPLLTTLKLGDTNGAEALTLDKGGATTSRLHFTNSIGSALIEKRGNGNDTIGVGAIRAYNNDINVVFSGGTGTLSINCEILQQSPYVTRLSVSGPGTLIIGGSAAFTHSGGTVINAATLQIGNDNRLGATTGGVTIGNNGTLRASGANVILDVNRSTLLKGGGSAVFSTVTNTQTLTLSGPVSSDPLSPSSLVAAGPGLISLLGMNTYAGPTIVTGGTLSMVAANYTGGGALALSNSAALSVVAPSNTKLDMASATLGDGGEVTLNFSYGAVAGVNPSLPALNVNGLNAGATNIVINVSGSGFIAGQFPLIDYTGTIGGNGFAAFRLMNLPPGVLATLVHNTANSSIDLNISLTVNLLSWYGSVSDQWDIAGALNWNSGTAAYNQFGPAGDIVLFDDSLDPANLRTNINLTTALSPAILNVTNNSYEYIFSGAGKLTGGTIFNKSGLQALTITTPNDYTGGSTVGQGIVRLANDTALGSGLIGLAGGGLSSSDSTGRTLTNSLKITAATVFGDLTANGKMTLSGPIDFGGAARDLTISSDVVVSNIVANGGLDQKLGPGTLRLDGVTGTMNAGQMQLEQGALIINGGNIYKSGGGIRVVCMQPNGTAYLSISNSAIITMAAAGSNLRIGSSADPISDPNATNIVDLAATISWTSNNVTGGKIQLGGSCAFAQLNLKSGGFLRPRQLVYDGDPLVNTSEVNLDGGTLAALEDMTTFFQGLPAAYIRSGGVVIDTEDKQITIAQALLNGGGGGSLTKNGAGKLTLTGTNTYTGSTVVNAGTLILGPAHASPGTISASSGATVGFLSTAPGASVSVSTVTIGSGGALRAEFTGQSGNPVTPAAAVNSLTLNGVVPVSVSGSGFTAGGTIPLISYTTLAGGGSVTTGQLPQGVTGTIVLNTGAKRIELLITAVAPLLWTGFESAFWDVNLATNWSVGGNRTVFLQGDTVRLDDSADLPSVIITEPVSPSAVVVSNNALPYTLSATVSGKLSGGTGLVKQGTNTLTVSGTHDFSGNVALEGGTFIANSATALGDTNGTTTILPGATLDTAGNNLRSERITVSGSGWNGQGAIICSVQNQNSLRFITMVGDTAFGGTGGVQWGFQDPVAGGVGVTNLNANGFKLTKVGSGDLLFKDLGETYLGDIDIVESALSFQFSTTMGDPAKTCTVSSNGVLAFRDQEVIWDKILVINGGTVRNTQPAVLASFSGPTTLNGVCKFQVEYELQMLGVIGGAGSIVKSDVGVLGLEAANTYTGSTVISNGTVRLGASGSIAASTNIFVETAATLDVSLLSSFALGAGQTLSGNGSINGSVIANGTVAPGASIGTLTFTNNLALAGLTILEITKDGGIASDLVNVMGSLSLGGALQVVLVGTTPLAVNDTFDLFNWTAVSGSFTSVALPPGYTWDTTQLAANGTIRVAGVFSISSTQLSGNTFTFNGSGGTPAGTYYVLSTTNVSLPILNWLPILTNVFDSLGNFSVTNTVTSEPARFFRLATPSP